MPAADPFPQPLNHRPAPAAERAEEAAKPAAPAAPPGKGSPAPDGDGEEQEAEAAFAVFDWPRYAAKWDVPWGAREAVLGMMGWAGSFVAVGLAFLPLIREYAGPGGFAALTQQDKALLALANQVVATAAGIGVVNFAVREFRPLPPGLLRVDLAAPFRKPDGWAAWALLGVLAAPAVVVAAGALVDALGVSDPSGRGTADAVSEILSLDGTTFASLFATTAVLAPALEETVFRGFLLPSLAKFMPTPAAVALSSVAFGLVHLSPRDTPQLTALGVLLGFSYVRSRNLLTPMLIHGAWNGTVLVVLYSLQASGVDLQEMLHGGAGL